MNPPQHKGAIMFCLCERSQRSFTTTRRNVLLFGHAGATHAKKNTFHFTGWWVRICNLNFNGDYIIPPLSWTTPVFDCAHGVFFKNLSKLKPHATDHFLQVVHGRCLSLWGFFQSWRENPECFGRLIWNDLRVNVWDEIQLWIWNRRYGIFGIQAVFLFVIWSFFFKIFFRFSDDLASHLPIDLPILTIWQCPFLPRPCWISHQGAKSPAASTLRMASRRGNIAATSVWVEDWRRRFMPWVKLVVVMGWKKVIIFLKFYIYRIPLRVSPTDFRPQGPKTIPFCYHFVKQVNVG